MEVGVRSGGGRGGWGKGRFLERFLNVLPVARNDVNNTGECSSALKGAGLRGGPRSLRLESTVMRWPSAGVVTRNTILSNPAQFHRMHVLTAAGIILLYLFSRTGCFTGARTVF